MITALPVDWQEKTIIMAELHKKRRKRIMERRQPIFQIKEQNFSGATSLYRSSPHRAYVAEVEQKNRIRGDMLQEAVNQTLRRMPYFADALTEKDGDFYYAVNPLPTEAAETKQLRRVGGPETNWHCVDVTWWGNTVSFSMFHALCDGLGLNLFIESVIYHYFCIRDGKRYDAKGIRTVGFPVLPREEDGRECLRAGRNPQSLRNSALRAFFVFGNMV